MTFKGKKPSSLFNSEEGYDLLGKNYDKKNRFLDSFENNLIYKFTGDVKGKMLLDMGAGTGRILKHFVESGAQVHAIDVSKNMLLVLSEKYPSVKILHCDAKCTPYEDESFDIIIATFLLVHINDTEKLFNEAYRLLKPGGIFVVSNVNQRKPPKLRVQDKKHKEITIKSYYHRPEDVKTELTNCWFNIEDEETVYEKKAWINQIIKAVK